MTNYTTKFLLTEKTATEVKSIAKNEYKLALSSNGKRFTKEELVSSIMKEQSKRKRKATMQAKKFTGEQQSGKAYSFPKCESEHVKKLIIGHGNPHIEIIKNKKKSAEPIQDNHIHSEYLMFNYSNDLNVNKVETIVMQATKLLKESSDNDALKFNIERVENTISELQGQIKEEKRNMFQNKKRSYAIKMLNILVKQYERKVV